MTEEAVNNLEVYKLSHGLAVRVHQMSLTLPSIERYEEASQIRRSSKRISASIVEGHTLRKYKAHYLSYLYRGLASCDETQEHLKYLVETKSLRDEKLGGELLAAYTTLSKKLFRFIRAIESSHEAPKYLRTPVGDVLEPGDTDEVSEEVSRQLSSINRQQDGARHPSSVNRQRAAKESSHG